MTTFAGATFEKGEFALIAGITALFTGLHTKDERQVGFDGFQISAGGAFSNNLPIDLNTENFGGGRNVFSFLDDFYFRIYFIPREADFGAVANIVTRSVKMWNAYLTPVDLDAVTGSNNEGVSITLPGALPFELLGLSIWDIDFIASPDGPPEIDASYLFEFSNGDEHIVPVIGDRARLWTYPVNWGKDVEVGYDWRTEVITSYAKREQRNALRSNPRKEIQFEFHATFDGLRLLNNTMAQWVGRPFIVPEWPRFTKMAEPLGIFDDAVEVDAVPDWLVAEMTVMLVYEKQFETREIESVIGTTVTFTTTTGTAWPTGTKMHPGLACNLRGGFKATRKTNAVAVGTANFDVIPVSEIVEIIPAATELFKDREVFLKRHNWAQDMDTTYESFRDQIDYGRGRIESFFPAPYNSRIVKLSFLNRNTDEADLLREFIYRMKGQQGEFYRPTFENDLIPMEDVVLGTVFFRFAGLTIYDTYEQDTVFRAVYVKMNDGSYCYNLIHEISTIDGDTQIEFTDPWPFDIAVADILMVSWMPVWRLASDSFNLSWRTDSVCDAAITIKVCEELGVEEIT